MSALVVERETAQWIFQEICRRSLSPIHTQTHHMCKEMKCLVLGPFTAQIECWLAKLGQAYTRMETVERTRISDHNLCAYRGVAIFIYLLNIFILGGLQKQLYSTVVPSG